MGRINIEIPDELHDAIRNESDEERIPMKIIIIEQLYDRYDDEELVDQNSE